MEQRTYDLLCQIFWGTVFLTFVTICFTQCTLPKQENELNPWLDRCLHQCPTDANNNFVGMECPITCTKLYGNITNCQLTNETKVN